MGTTRDAQESQASAVPRPPHPRKACPAKDYHNDLSPLFQPKRNKNTNMSPYLDHALDAVDPTVLAWQREAVHPIQVTNTGTSLIRSFRLLEYVCGDCFYLHTCFTGRRVPSPTPATCRLLAPQFSSPLPPQYLPWASARWWLRRCCCSC